MRPVPEDAGITQYAPAEKGPQSGSGDGQGVVISTWQVVRENVRHPDSERIVPRGGPLGEIIPSVPGKSSYPARRPS